MATTIPNTDVLDFASVRDVRLATYPELHLPTYAKPVSDT